MHVAIVGAGIAGLCIALTLHSRGIECTLYESKEAAFRTTGALMLAPNALRILDSLGLYQRLQARGFNFDTVEFRTDQNAITDVWQMGSKERYGYQALRIRRPRLLEELRAAVSERGIAIHYGTTYSHIIEETSDAVRFALGNGTQVTTQVLIGADGISSAVRNNVVGEIHPEYRGMIFLLANIKHRLVHDGEACPQTTYYHSQAGAFHIMPQEIDGSETCLGKVCLYPEQDKEGLRALQDDHNKVVELFLQETETWPTEIQNLLPLVKEANIEIWPMQDLRQIESWTTPAHRRIILIGDAAHCVQPQGGQGSCQAVEDAYTLAMVVARALKAQLSEDSWKTSISTWEKARQLRVEKAKAFTTQLSNNQLPPAERQKLPPGTYWEPGQHPDLSWLYGAGLANSDAKGVTRVEVRRQTNGSVNIGSNSNHRDLDGTNTQFMIASRS